MDRFQLRISRSRACRGRVGGFVAHRTFATLARDPWPAPQQHAPARRPPTCRNANKCKAVSLQLIICIRLVRASPSPSATGVLIVIYLSTTLLCRTPAPSRRFALAITWTYRCSQNRLSPLWFPHNGDAVDRGTLRPPRRLRPD
jgi:hypothetical protein